MPRLCTNSSVRLPRGHPLPGSSRSSRRKLLLMPLAVLAGCLALGLSGKAVQVSVFEAAMPPMITAGALAMMAGLAPRLIAALVGFGLLLSFVTLPAWSWLLHRI